MIVDHTAPDTFDALARRFAQEMGFLGGPFPLAPSKDGELGRGIGDSKVDEAWKKFHKLNAKLRVIRKENHRKAKRCSSATTNSAP